MKSKGNRLNFLKTLLSNGSFRSQNDLLAALAQKGFKLTQATLSRDLKMLKVAKAACPDGSYAYIIPKEKNYKRTSPTLTPDPLLQSYGVLSVSMSENIGVVKTHPGYALLLASQLDKSGIPEILGTIAGYDTVFVVVKSGTHPFQFHEAMSNFLHLNRESQENSTTQDNI